MGNIAEEYKRLMKFLSDAKKLSIDLKMVKTMNKIDDAKSEAGWEIEEKLK